MRKKEQERIEVVFSSLHVIKRELESRKEESKEESLDIIIGGVEDVIKELEPLATKKTLIQTIKGWFKKS